MKQRFIVALILISMLLAGCGTKTAETETASSPVPATMEPVTTEVLKLNTTLQVVPEYGQCYFFTDRDDSNTWYFVDEHNNRFTIEEMRQKCPPAFGAIADEEGGLWLYNIGKWLDEWSVMCVYPDGAVSEAGLIKIDYDLPAEPVMMHPM